MAQKKHRNIVESYGLLTANDRKFDCQFWQAQGAKAIFDAAYEMIKDYLLLKEGHADEPRIQRSVEAFGKTQMLIDAENLERSKEDHD